MIPAPLIALMHSLEARRCPCYLVGGAVRDLLLGLEPADYDLAAAAPPEVIKQHLQAAGFNPSYQLQRGTVGLRLPELTVEITPLKAVDLEGDLATRDFTVNALALTAEERLIDPYGGADDLRHRRLRLLGDPVATLLTDPLRSFRAARLLSTLDLQPDPTAQWALASPLVRTELRQVAVERVRTELELMLCGPEAAKALRLLAETGLLSATCAADDADCSRPVPILPEVSDLQEIPQNPRYHYFDVFEHTLRTVSASPPLRVLRWAALLHDIAKGSPPVRRIIQGRITDHGHEAAGAQITARILQRLRVDHASCRRVIWLVGNHMRPPSSLRWARHRAADFNNRRQFDQAVEQLFDLIEADRSSHTPEVQSLPLDREGFRSMLGTIPLYPAELAIDGAEVVRFFGQGPQVGAILRELLIRVQSGTLLNSRPDLLAALEQKSARRQAESAQ